ncbi:MAG: small heat shock protein sHSP20 [Rhodoferax sp.]
MNLDLQKWAPWNWFKKEQDADQSERKVAVGGVDDGLGSPARSLDPLLQLHRDVDRLFDEAFRGFGLAWPRMMRVAPPVAPASTWLRPALDIQATDQHYLITLEVPGVDEKDIQIHVNEDVLWIRGEKRQSVEHREGQFHRVERSYGTFQRALNLPEDANQDAIKARFKNGVLTVSIERRAKPESPAGRQIPIELS